MVTHLPWQLERNLNSSYVLSHIEATFGIKVPLDDKHQPYTLLLWLLSCHGNQRFLNNSFILSPIGFIFDMDVP